MSTNGIAQIVFYLAVVAALTPPLGLVHRAGLRGAQRPRADARARARRARHLPAAAHRRVARAGLEGLLRGGARVQRRELRAAVRDPAPPGAPAAQPERLPGHELERRVQHGGQLRHQHQLAVLRRRGDPLLPEPDGRPDGAELRVGRRRHGRARRRHPGVRAPRHRSPRQLLGRPGAHHALHPAAAGDRVRPDPRLAGRDADVLRPGELPDPRGAHARAPPTPPASRPPSPSTAARSRRRSPSSSSAPTAAATTTPTPRCPSRTPAA